MALTRCGRGSNFLRSASRTEGFSMNRNRLMTVLLVPVASASLAGCGVNAIPTAEENVKAKWADVQADYQRRANLIPNLVATVKGAAASEQNILVGVTNARANATRITVSGDQLSDPQAMARFAFAALALLASPACSRAAPAASADPSLHFPTLTGRVVDQADLLSPAEEQALAAQSAALERDTKAQYVVVTVPSLQGAPIEDYGVRL